MDGAVRQEDDLILSEEIAEGGLEAIFDPFSGIAGDMILGSWADLGLNSDWLLNLADLLSLQVAGIRVERVLRAGLAAAKVTIVPGVEARQVRHGRHFSEIRELIEASALEDRAKRLALGAFGRLASAEGRVHGVEPGRVHFHEVGAVDAILDVCGAADGFVRLGIGVASTLPIALGQGNVQIEHGTYPVPAPATAYLLCGVQVQPRRYPYECVTPTGAALLTEFCRGRVPSGSVHVVQVGYGAGDHDPKDHPNCLRVWLTRPEGDVQRSVVVLQTDVDDMTPEYVPGLIEACLTAGALDAVVYNVQGKKGRVGWRLEVQVEPPERAVVEEAILRHSTTLGLRSWSVQRRVLWRSVESRSWRNHRIRVKTRQLPGADDDRRAKAEHEDVAAAAAAEGMEACELLRLLRREWPDLS